MDTIFLFNFFHDIVLPIVSGIASSLIKDLTIDNKIKIFHRITDYKEDIYKLYEKAFKKTAKNVIKTHTDYKKFKQELKKLTFSSLELMNKYFDKKAITLSQAEAIAQGKAPQELLDSFHTMLRQHKIKLESSLCREFLRDLFKEVRNTFYSLVSKDNNALYREIILRELALSGNKSSQILAKQDELQKQIASLESLFKNFLIIKYDLFKRDDDISFYKGTRPTWCDIASDRDVIREIFHQLFPKIIDSKNAKKCSYLPIIAGGGEGKSTLLMRIAYELFARGEQVIFADASVTTINPYNEIRDIYNKLNPPHLFVLIDNIARLGAEPNRFYDQLLYQLSLNTDLNITFIGASQINDWIDVEAAHTSNINYLYQGKEEVYKLELTKQDFTQTQNKLKAMKLLKAPKSRRVRKSFLALMINFIYGREHKFGEYVRDETKKLSYIEKKLYAYVSALDRFGLGMPRSLITRIMDKGFDGILYDLQRKGILSLRDNNMLETRHELIAEIIYDNFCKKQPVLIEEESVYRDIINSVEMDEEEIIIILLQYYLEKHLLHKLKADVIGKFNQTFIKSNSPENLALGWGVIFDEMEDNSFAEIAYQRALQLKEDYVWAHNNYANLLKNLNRNSEAEIHYKRALELKENFPEAHYNYAVLLDKLSQNSDAEKHFKRALELKEDFPVAWAYLGFLYFKENFFKPEKGIKCLKKALQSKDKLPDKGKILIDFINIYLLTLGKK